MDFFLYKDWLYFSKPQRQGIRFLLVLIILTPLAGKLIRQAAHRMPSDQQAFLDEIGQFMANTEAGKHLSENEVYDHGEAVSKYRAMDTVLAEPNIPNRTSYTLPIDINKADSIQLQAIRGIGPVLGSRIVRYRDLLGGFYCTTQLGEVYGIDSIRVLSILSQVRVDALSVKTLNINTAGFGDLLRHPYLNRDQVIAITAWRTDHGAFKNLHHMLEEGILDTLSWNKLRPYLTAD